MDHFGTWDWTRYGSMEYGVPGIMSESLLFSNPLVPSSWPQLEGDKTLPRGTPVFYTGKEAT